jgi:adenine-specific DNA-methyltransferase
LANALDALLAHISDQELRTAISHEVARLKDSKDFGLVFERHMPESVRLLDYPISRGSQVQERSRVSGPTWFVDKISNGVASLVDKKTGEPHELPLSDLVALKGFGEVIYPGFKNVGNVRKGGDKPSSVLVNGENFYVLESLLYSFEEKVDAIYIDPPYNTGARDWKYDNNYVDDADAYRHSKWLAFMERRLKLAKQLLNPQKSVLIVTIDEKEYLRLGLLLEQVFPGSDIQMISSVISPTGSSRAGRFSRTDEYIFFVFIGEAVVRPWNSDMLREVKASESQKVRWASLIRNGEGSRRSRIPSLFYPIFIDEKTGAFHSVGRPLEASAPASSVKCPEGTIALLPIDGSGQELMWRLHPPSLVEYLGKGYAKFGRRDPVTGLRSPSYIQSGTIARIESGDIKILGYDDEGAAILEFEEGAKTYAPLTVWNKVSHSASDHATSILKALIPGRKFPYPKSLYAVEDTLRFVVKDNPDALIVDFFAGSGTTGHAVMRLNKQDGGNRRFILVTNNEVSEEESSEMRKRGLAPGDPEWEARGIYQFVTKPRLEAAVSGKTPTGETITGDYKFTDTFPMSDGFEENIDFLELQYLDPNKVSRGKAFEKIAPLIWMKAGFGPVQITEEKPDYALADGCNYGILFDLDKWPEFVEAVRQNSSIKHAFVVTDSRAAYQQVIQELDSDISTTMLYEDYLRNFEISIGGQ